MRVRENKRYEHIQSSLSAHVACISSVSTHRLFSTHMACIYISLCTHGLYLHTWLIWLTLTLILFDPSNFWTFELLNFCTFVPLSQILSDDVRWQAALAWGQLSRHQSGSKGSRRHCLISKLCFRHFSGYLPGVYHTMWYFQNLISSPFGKGVFFALW